MPKNIAILEEMAGRCTIRSLAWQTQHFCVEACVLNTYNVKFGTCYVLEVIEW